MSKVKNVGLKGGTLPKGGSSTLKPPPVLLFDSWKFSSPPRSIQEHITGPGRLCGPFTMHSAARAYAVSCERTNYLSRVPAVKMP